jgi:hypothetical protein
MQYPARRWTILLLLYSSLVVGWLGFARWGPPAIIVAAHEGRSIPFLNQTVRGSTSPPPIELVFQRWWNFARGAALAILLHLLIVFFIDLLNRRKGASTDDRLMRVERWTDRLFIVLALVFLGVTVYAGGIQDYYFYLAMWHGVLNRGDPWAITQGAFGTYPMNAYGPLFNVLAIPAWINPLLPKLLFADAYLAFAVWLIKDGAGRRRSAWEKFTLFAWLFNPYVWIEIPCFGHFDVLVGLCCVAAVAARACGRDVRSGVCLGLGALIKFMPIVLLPFLALDRPRYRYRLLGTAVGIVAAGFLVSVLIWGSSTFRPVLFAAERTSQHLSIFRFLKGRNSPLRLIGLREDLDRLAGPVMLLALLRAWLWFRRNQIHVIPASVLAILILVSLYPVGFPQYQMVLFLLSSFWVTRETPVIPNRAFLLFALVCHFAWLSFFVVFESISNIDNYNMQEWIGLPTFILECLLGWAIVRSAIARAGGLDEGQDATALAALG